MRELRQRSGTAAARRRAIAPDSSGSSGQRPRSSTRSGAGARAAYQAPVHSNGASTMTWRMPAVSASVSGAGISTGVSPASSASGGAPSPSPHGRGAGTSSTTVS